MAILEGEERRKRTCRICGGKVPLERHTNAVTCSAECGAENDKNNRMRANRRWYRRNQALRTTARLSGHG